jgi:endonuclease/exonuclease/phosphatase family metal-dependent hydrolase
MCSRYAPLISLILMLLPMWRSDAREFYIASWNLENLFDFEDDLAVEGDEEYLPTAPKQWTPERASIKLGNLSKVIGQMNAGRGPDVLGVCEVENRKAVEMLAAKLGALNRNYQIIHQDSPSDRGIDCAILYDANVFELVDSRFHFVDAANTRDIVEARFRHESHDLYVFMNHWPSRGNDEWQRCLAAVVLRNRLDEILTTDPQADFLLLGDFNDESHNVSLTKFLRVAPTPEDLPTGALYDTSAPIQAAGKGTFVFGNAWELIDHIIVSPGMLDSAGYHWKPDSTRTMDLPDVFFHPRFPGAIPRPSKSYADTTFHKSGYSDHLAVGCIIEK